MNQHYVYVHKRMDNGETFYVGKGCGQRAKNFYSGRTQAWREVARVAKGFTIHYEAKGLSWEQAAILEAQTIAWHLEQGSPLVNRKLRIEKRNVMGKDVDGYYVFKNILCPGKVCCTFTEMVVTHGCSPLELQDLLGGRIAITDDGWMIGATK